MNAEEIAKRWEKVGLLPCLTPTGSRYMEPSEAVTTLSRALLVAIERLEWFANPDTWTMQSIDLSDAAADALSRIREERT